MILTPFVAVAGGLLFAAISFFFALAETALFSLEKWETRRLSETGGARGRAVAGLLSRPQDLLATIVFGNTLANAVIVVLPIWVALREGWSLVWTPLILLASILVGCEVIPKALAVRAPERWALAVGRPMSAIQRVSQPLRGVAQWLIARMLQVVVPKSVQPQALLSEEEYLELVELAAQQGSLGPAETRMIQQIIRLDRRTAKDVMKPRTRMACIPDDLTVEEMIEAARKFKQRRLPVYDETPDTIVGVLNTRTFLLDPRNDLVEAIEFPSFVPESMNLLTLLKSLQRQERGLAIVLDEFGTTAGIVTMEDILEELVGDIRGEGEQEGFLMERLGDGRWRVNGAMRIEGFRREYAGIGAVEEVDTLGGLVTMLNEVVPAAGQTVNFRGLRLTAQTVDERRVREVLVEVIKKRGAA